MGERIKGLVKWFNDAKGFGFIENGKGDVFVHYSVIDSPGFKTLKDGEEVEYEMEQGDKGLHAKKVVRTSPPPESTDKRKGGSLAKEIEVERIPTPTQDTSFPGAMPAEQTPQRSDEESDSKPTSQH